MRKKLSKVLGLFSVIVIITGCSAPVTEIEEVNETPSVEIKQEVPIELMPMKRELIQRTYIAVGDVVPKNQVDIYINGNGFIETVNAVTGEYIEKDKLIIELDNNDKNFANYNATESQLRTVRDNLSDRLVFLQDNYDKQLILFNEGIITQVEFNQVANQIPTLERDYENAKVSYNNQLSLLRKNLEDTSESKRTYSPVSGRVAAVYVNEGQAVSNQLGLTIIDDSGLFIRAYVSGNLKKLLNVDDKVRIKLDGQEDALEETKIVEIQDIPDANTKLFEILIEITNQESYIIGDYAEVEFIVESYKAVMVPMKAIIRRGSERYIYIYKNDLLEEVKIEPGRTSGEWLEVKNIDLLSKVVVRGQNQIISLEDFVIIE